MLNASVAGSSNLLATAFLHETNRTLTLILLNTSTSTITASVSVHSLPFPLANFRTFTSQNGDLWRTSSVNVANGVAAVTVPGYGITTLYGVASPRLSATLKANLFQVSWEPAAPGFQLLTAPQIGPPVNWTPVTNAPAFTNNVATVALPFTAGAAYFRLVLP